jgi:ribosomal protein S18 acetylase RimI-like enzyme
LCLHHHHRSVVDFPLQPDDEVSWEVRERTYLTALGDGTGFILVAREAYEAVGYLTVMLGPGGPDDTFDLGPTYAEIYSLVVSPAQRSRGIGSLLFQTALDELERRGVQDLKVAVMAGNEDAVRFYMRQGLVPAELHLWKFGSSGPGGQT